MCPASASGRPSRATLPRLARPPVLGAGLRRGVAGAACAVGLQRGGLQVTLFDKSRGVGGRMATRRSAFGGFDHGAQYFTVRDPRFSLALQTVPGTADICRPWSANAVRVLDPLGHVFEAARATKDAHFVAKPGMNALVRHWAEPLGKAITYALNQWPNLQTYLSDGRVEIDNNLVENAIRPTKLGARNWLFIGAEHAGEKSAIIYTLVENCRRLDINPRDYLEDVLTRLPTWSVRRIHELTPAACAKAARRATPQAA